MQQRHQLYKCHSKHKVGQTLFTQTSQVRPEIKPLTLSKDPRLDFFVHPFTPRPDSINQC